jgi:hypothetical protein
MLKHNLLHGKTQQIGLSPKEWFGRSKFGPFSLRENRQKRENLFDASPYAITTSDPIRVKNKNITGFGPRDLIDLDS